MNERIKELKEKTLVWAIETLDPDVLNENEWGVSIDEKFAELIIQECANIVNSLEQHEGQGDCSTAEYIKEHFGV